MKMIIKILNDWECILLFLLNVALLFLQQTVSNLYSVMLWICPKHCSMIGDHKKNLLCRIGLEPGDIKVFFPSLTSEKELWEKQKEKKTTTTKNNRDAKCVLKVNCPQKLKLKSYRDGQREFITGLQRSICYGVWLKSLAVAILLWTLCLKAITVQ